MGIYVHFAGKFLTMDSASDHHGLESEPTVSEVESSIECVPQPSQRKMVKTESCSTSQKARVQTDSLLDAHCHRLESEPTVSEVESSIECVPQPSQRKMVKTESCSTSQKARVQTLRYSLLAQTFKHTSGKIISMK